MTEKEIEMYDWLVEMGIATADEIGLVFHIAGGDRMELMNAILFDRTGYRDMEQFLDEEGNY